MAGKSITRVSNSQDEEEKVIGGNGKEKVRTYFRDI
jgi:hypothetical protein